MAFLRHVTCRNLTWKVDFGSIEEVLDPTFLGFDRFMELL